MHFSPTTQCFPNHSSDSVFLYCMVSIPVYISYTKHDINNLKKRLTFLKRILGSSCRLEMAEL